MWVGLVLLLGWVVGVLGVGPPWGGAGVLCLADAFTLLPVVCLLFALRGCIGARRVCSLGGECLGVFGGGEFRRCS